MMGTDFPGFGFGGNCSSNAFQKCKGLLQGGVADDSVDTTLRLDPLTSKAPHHPISKGLKRKWFGMDRNMSQQAKRTSGLSLAHRSSSSPESRSSSGTACTEEESSQVLDLDFTLNLGTEKSPSSHKPVGFVSAYPLMNVDLELSLSTVCSEPDMSSLQLDSPVMQMSDDGPDGFGGALFNDAPPAFVGKTGNIMPPFPVPERRDPNFFFKPVPRRIDSASFSSDFLAGVVTVPISSVTCTSGSVQTNLQEQPQRSNNSKMCKFSGCSKGARGASGLCIAHGGGRRCQKLGCHKGAEGRTAFCKAHGGGRRCEFLGCTKSSEGRTDFCIAHGGGRRCTHESCNKAARGKSGLCIRHGGGKRCQWENCTRSAEGLSGLCISHGGGRRCQYPLCRKGAQGSTMLCKAHGGGKRCTIEGCSKGAEGSTPFCKGHGGGKRCSFPCCPKSVHGGTSFCVAHGGGKRCAVSECTKSARGKTDFCVRHGGGRRCQFEGCGKSAQGSTDFCKVHGGGKRCSWAQPGSNYGNVGDALCGSYARGKNGLCTMHGALVQDKRVHGGITVGPLVHDPESSQPTRHQNMYSEGDTSEDYATLGCSEATTSAGTSGCEMNNLDQGASSSKAPEGRVHGGSLLAMLAGSSRV